MMASTIPPIGSARPQARLATAVTVSQSLSRHSLVVCSPSSHTLYIHFESCDRLCILLYINTHLFISIDRTRRQAQDHTLNVFSFQNEMRLRLDFKVGCPCGVKVNFNERERDTQTIYGRRWFWYSVRFFSPTFFIHHIYTYILFTYNCLVIYCVSFRLNGCVMTMGIPLNDFGRTRLGGKQRMVNWLWHVMTGKKWFCFER